jgi:hypothetical protein
MRRLGMHDPGKPFRRNGADSVYARRSHYPRRVRRQPGRWRARDPCPVWIVPCARTQGEHSVSRYTRAPIACGCIRRRSASTRDRDGPQGQPAFPCERLRKLERGSSYSIPIQHGAPCSREAHSQQTAPGRAALLAPMPADAPAPSAVLEYPLAKLVVFTEHPDLIRRGGVVSTIKRVHRCWAIPEAC